MGVYIECKIRRKGGTRVVIDGRTYTFRPEGGPDGPHVARVDHEGDRDRFLSISEGYRLHDVAGPSRGVAARAAAAAVPDPEPAESELPKTERDVVAEERARLERLTEAELRSRYHSTLNRVPPPAIKRETLIARIIDAAAPEDEAA